MWIKKLRLQTAKLDEQRTFYVETLAFPLISQSPTQFSVRVGITELTFEGDPTFTDAYHFALNIPENQFDEAKAWLRQYLPLIADSAGREIFDFTSWNAHSLYFYDAAGNVVEFIARHDLPNATLSPFTIESLLCVSEIGLAADQPLETAATLLAKIEGLSVFRGEQSPTFNALGTDNGIVIIVKTRREWYPESGRHAALSPLTVELQIEEQKLYRLEMLNGHSNVTVLSPS